MTAERLEKSIADHQAGRFKEAEAGYEAVLSEDPRHPDANNLLAVLCCQRREYDRALTYAKIAIAVGRAVPEFHNNHGLALKGLERFDEAVVAFEKALELAPQYADALYNLGMVELDRRNYEDGLAQLVACKEAASHHAQVRNGMSLAFLRLGRSDEAIAILDEQFEMRPKDLDAFNNLCVAHTMRGDYAKARAVAEKSVALNGAQVDIRLNRAHLMLLHEEFIPGFAEHEWRLRRHDYRQKFHVPRWEGEALPEGKIMIWAEQGFGDAIHFIRYLPMVKERVGQVLLKCRAPLRPLFATLPEVDQVIMPRTAVSYDVHAPLMSMPYIFKTDADTIPAQVPYIPRPSPMALAGDDTKCKVGLVWAGNPDHARDQLRSRALADLAPLAAVENTEYFSLQFGPAASQTPPSGLEVTDLTPNIDDFLGTAHALVGLDLLITVDTSVAHLAGALGLPVWIVIAETPDWRWQLGRADSPWYPSARLFRSDGDYEGLFSFIAEELQKFAAK